MLIRSGPHWLIQKSHRHFSSAVQLAYKNYFNDVFGPISPPIAREKPPLLILHGLFGSKQNWNSVGKAMQRRLPDRKVMAIDLRNHGDSPHVDGMTYEEMFDDVRHFIVSMFGSTEVAILGHSLGGRVAATVALSMQSQIDRVVFEDIVIKPFIGASPQDVLAATDAMLGIELANVKTLSEARKMVILALEKVVPNLPTRQFLANSLAQDENMKIYWKNNLVAFKKNADNFFQFSSSFSGTFV